MTPPTSLLITDDLHELLTRARDAYIGPSSTRGLAEQISVSHTTIAELFTRRRATIKATTLRRITDLLGLPWDEVTALAAPAPSSAAKPAQPPPKSRPTSPRRSNARWPGSPGSAWSCSRRDAPTNASTARPLPARRHENGPRGSAPTPGALQCSLSG